MQANELRLGNYLHGFHDKTISINGVYDEEEGLVQCGGILYSINQVQPIPLTEEWLFKLGFIKAPKTSHYGGYLCSGYNGGSSFLRLLRVGNHFNWNHKRMDYVHQLQNFYFALTGEELCIK